MTEAEWLAATDPVAMLTFLRDSERASERKLRLFACGCARRIYERIPRLADAADLVERYADGLARAEEFRRLGDPVMVRRGGDYLPYLGSRDAGVAASGTSVWVANVVSGRSKPQGYTDPRYLAERAAHAALLRDIFNPFRPVALDPVWLTRLGGTVPRLAEAAYAERALPEGTLNPARLAVLGDALEEAGCTDAGLLGHLRGQGPHVRGCWAVDRLLGIE
jgi:hypothetical protein